jgi:hypothetical protein
MSVESFVKKRTELQQHTETVIKGTEDNETYDDVI